MSSELMTIGAAPSEESCAQVGSDDYHDRSRRECAIYGRMLERLFPLPENVPARIVVMGFPHDFGTYREVCVRYEDSDPRACDYAFRMESQSPVQWDAIARYELIWLERLEQFRRAVESGNLQPQEVPEAYRVKKFPVLPPDHSFHELLAAFPL